MLLENVTTRCDVITTYNRFQQVSRKYRSMSKNIQIFDVCDGNRLSQSFWNCVRETIGFHEDPFNFERTL